MDGRVLGGENGYRAMDAAWSASSALAGLSFAMRLFKLCLELGQLASIHMQDVAVLGKAAGRHVLTKFGKGGHPFALQAIMLGGKVAVGLGVPGYRIRPQTPWTTKAAVASGG